VDRLVVVGPFALQIDEALDSKLLWALSNMEALEIATDLPRQPLAVPQAASASARRTASRCNSNLLAEGLAPISH
jgi:hypothetical protein